MIEFDEACELIFENIHQLGTEECPIENAVGRALARDVISAIDVAPFRNSAMDGFAVKSEWLKECSSENPVVIPVGRTVFAGSPASDYDAEKEAIKVMTGARVPDEFDAVVPFEETDYDEAQVRFFGPAAKGKHVRLPGEDIVRGQRLYEKGAVLGRLDIGILASVGLRSVSTFRRPSILIVGTGDELIEPGEELHGDRIYDANTFTILSLVTPFCSSAKRTCRVADSKDELKKILNSGHDMIVTSGGVSAGERDLVVKIAESCGWQTIFHKVRIKPGKPVYFAVRNGQLLFGIPGNSLSAAVTCLIFLIPALKKIAGFSDYRLKLKPAALAPGETRKSDRKLIWPGFIKEEAGRAVARFSPKKSSAALTAFFNTDGLIIRDFSKKGSTDDDIAVIRWSDLLKYT
jgi:molybdopterin molybdotransferase